MNYRMNHDVQVYTDMAPPCCHNRPHVTYHLSRRAGLPNATETNSSPVPALANLPSLVCVHGWRTYRVTYTVRDRRSAPVRSKSVTGVPTLDFDPSCWTLTMRIAC